VSEVDQEVAFHIMRNNQWGRTSTLLTIQDIHLGLSPAGGLLAKALSFIKPWFQLHRYIYHLCLIMSKLYK
jgi:hypothetical protein